MRWHLAMGRFLVGLTIVVVLGGCTSSATSSPSVTATPTSVSSAAAATQTPAPTPATAITASALPVASSVDVGDQAAASAGASFVATATGILPPSSGGSSADRLPGEPNPSLTPGALNPAVTQATIGSTICVSGWTATIRPSESFTYALKVKQIVEYGYSDTRTSSYEEDHLISLELGGAPADARNLWPEPYTDSLPDGRPTGAYTKDAFETKLKTEVCAGSITLAQAQSDIGDQWVHAYYVIPLGVSPTNPAATVAPTARVTSAPTTPILTAPPVASLSVSITSLPASVSPGANATLSALTSPGATCSASVTYASGTVSSATGLKSALVADSSGKVSWTWKVGSSTGSGTSTAEVTCTLGSDSASDSKTFEVT
ncbi:MAG: hypothetical protein ABSB34_11905 [Candidatus Limnocylindrales bacterium]|jgi:hypothetical protein